jgi:Xaa-Pro dipeptidase
LVPEETAEKLGGQALSELSFAAVEFEERVGKVRNKMKSAGLDALILTRGENIFYVSGFRGAHFASWLSELHALIIPMDAAPQLMTRALEREVAKFQTASPQLYEDHENPYELLVRILQESGNAAKTIGVEERFLKLSQFKNMRRHLQEAALIDATGLVEGVAAWPSEAETTCLRRAARIADVGMQAGIREIREGVYPYQIIGKIHDAMYQAGQRDFDMSLVCVWSGPQGGRMHDTWTAERIKRDDIVTVEVWGVDNHYKAGTQTSVYVGDDPSAETVAAYDLTAKMHTNAKNAVKAGASAGDIFAAANSVYRAARGADYYRRCGGSMGLTVFTVDLVKGSREVLVPGMALLIQTLVDEPVLLTCASTVMVTETGCEDMTLPLSTLKRMS